jgi:hypothetical protein
LQLDTLYDHPRCNNDLSNMVDGEPYATPMEAATAPPSCHEAEASCADNCRLPLDPPLPPSKSSPQPPQAPTMASSPRSPAPIIKIVGLEVTAVISPHQLIIRLSDACFKTGVLLKKLSVTLLNVLDGAVLDLHLADVLLQARAQVSARRYDLLKQGAHVLGVACRERPTRMVSRKLGVANGGHALTPHRVGLVLNGSKTMTVSSRTCRWRSQNSVRAWWAALSRASSRSSP